MKCHDENVKSFVIQSISWKKGQSVLNLMEVLRGFVLAVARLARPVQGRMIISTS